jgi:hypothetical protein
MKTTTKLFLISFLGFCCCKNAQAPQAPNGPLDCDSKCELLNLDCQSAEIIEISQAHVAVNDEGVEMKYPTWLLSGCKVIFKSNYEYCEEYCRKPSLAVCRTEQIEGEGEKTKAKDCKVYYEPMTLVHP